LSARPQLQPTDPTVGCYGWPAKVASDRIKLANQSEDENFRTAGVIQW
jgi:hypothetical protein